ncbi:protein of unknown function DUF488 [Xylanimonas cellulosilytica DSM 15894]|uniref:Uroporphyrin-III C-methyltransferase n=1 Tax=Xylanimonas cellulosilytica (strain DSM 15894 / JCM 12276 / CECT 5975 / KCTC 9989 / LMG 20990 / NBRC 107835 / XIL07) TaxID=446471 RepID=D1BTD1_XYLCX|nr:DUF488 family protein [Xylanimonas cellulosilytica]ACZ29073.1 protein of unknown function DUF488 [Xylanimonas cellulosilytica DSM 15894]
MPADLVLKRIYDEVSPDDGCRVLVDRLWPRGVSKERAALDLWLKEAAPSPELRTAWHHDPARFDEFAEAYRAELATNPAVEQLRELRASHERVTLLFAAHDPEVNHVVVLRDVIVGE